MSTDNIQQSLLEAMQLLSSNAAGSTNASMTIKGEIVELLDKSTHAYSVSYGGTIYKDVYSISDAIYPPSTVVYLFIPDRTDFSKPKFILGAVSPVASMYVTEAEEDAYIPIADNLFGEVFDIELKSPIDETIPINFGIPIENFNQLFNNYLKTYNVFLFSAYIKTNIDKNHQQTGNYGLQLTLPFVQKIDGLNISKTYKMDVSNIPGNPYALNEFQKVDLYFEIPDTLEYDTTKFPSLTAFVKDFGYFPIPNNPEADIWIKDISFQMVDVLAPEQKLGYYTTITATEGNYFIDGVYVNNKTLTPLLKVNSKDTKLDGWDCYWFEEDGSITTTSEDYYPLGGLGWKCLNEKNNIQINDEGRKTFQYVVNNYNLIVKPEDVIASLRYKCILVKDDIVTQGIIKLTNLQNQIETQLISVTGSNTFIEDIGTVRLIARIYYDGITNQNSLESEEIIRTLSTSWQRFDKNNNYIDNDFYTVIRENEQVIIDDKKYFETEISYPCSEIDKQNTVYCTFYRTITNNKNIETPIYDNEGNEIGVETQLIQVSTQSNLGTEYILINTTNEYTYTVSLSGGDVLYKYDADGDSPMVSNYDGPLTSRVKTIQPITFKLYKPDGSELTEDEYLYVGYRWSFPKNSMMKLESSYQKEDDNYYYIEGKGLSSINYSIANTYNKKKNDNTILFYAVFDNTAIETTTNIKFLKDGESGTNGTKYSAVIEHDDYGYGDRDPQGRVRKFQAVYYQPNENESGIWYKYDLETNSLIEFGEPLFTALVYKDGDRYTENLNYSWKLFESNSRTDSFVITKVENTNTAKLNINFVDNNPLWNETGQIIECAITIINGDTGNRETIYTYYPLEVTKVKKLGDIIPHLDGGFEEVVYASDGTNPKFDNSNDFHCTDSIYSLDGQDNYFIYNWDISDNLNIHFESGDEHKSTAKINPKTSFQNSQSKNFVKVSLNLNADKQSEINEKLSEVNNKITEDRNLLNYYRYQDEDHPGNLNYLKLFLNTTNTILDNQESNLNKIVDMLTLRQKMLEKINELRKNLIDYYDYCRDKQIDINKYNYTEIRTNLDSKLTRAYRNVYLLGLKATLDNINKNSSLDKVKIVSPTKGTLNDIIMSQIQVYMTNWDNLVKEYQQYWNELVAKNAGSNIYVYEEKYNQLVNIHNKLSEISVPNYLTREGNPEKEIFTNLKNEIKAVLDSRTNYETGTLLGYQNYINDVLDKIRNLLYNYNKEERQEIFYDAKIEEIEADLKIQETQQKAYSTYLIENTGVIIHVKPILFLYNRYEFANINGWDGNKLYIDENNSQYLLAPQVGAGIKNSDNSFTGLVMGIRNFSNGNSDVGLYGFVKGVQSIFLDANTGKAEFGIEKEGQIKIIPGNDAIIQSGDYGSGKGLKIKFNKNPEIKFGSGNFEVSPQGHLTAKGGGSIANWNIGNDKLTSSNNKTILNSDGTITCDTLIAKTNGNIGGWTINGNKLEHGNVTLDGSSGTIQTGPTKLDANGITNPGFTLTSSGFNLTSGIITLGNQGFGSAGISFSSSGTSISGTINANAGNIGGCIINNGLLQVPAARITGKLTANQVDANIVTVGSDGWVHASKANITTCSVVSLQNSAGGQTITFNHDDFVALYNLIHQ